MTDLVTFGEALVSFRTPAVTAGWQASAHVAGAEANVAIGLARWGHTVRWVGRVSDDRLGQWVVETLLEEGVDASFVVRDPHPAGAMVLESPADHQRRVTYLRRGSAGSHLAPEDALAALPGCARVHLTGITPALSASAAETCLAVAERARAEGLPVSLDVNHRPALWSSEDARVALLALLPFVTTLIASEDELPIVAAGSEADAVARLLAGGVEEVLIKRGEHGASLFTTEGTVDLPAKPVEVVDVIGAGDALCAGYLSGRIDGLDPAEALARGIDVAAACVAAPGDWEGFPRRGLMH